MSPGGDGSNRSLKPFAQIVTTICAARLPRACYLSFDGRNLRTRGHAGRQLFTQDLCEMRHTKMQASDVPGEYLQKHASCTFICLSKTSHNVEHNIVWSRL